MLAKSTGRVALSMIGVRIPASRLLTWCGDARVHIFWSKLLAHWLRKEVSEQLLLAHQDYMASRQAPPIGELFQRRMIEPYGQWTSEFADAARRLWWGMGYTLLWQIRNQVVHEDLFSDI
ncbi:hypothetical protein JG687_00016671 [Phytophthora cactorum]|uniref:Uncharacterized protein n=1 Tax=Phytophthora cactorum TaxID=29920 RepID=A0A8T1TTH6_9STRA|nr:hypothetical protein JG687_00016671 [Phytophthora cactorum]